LPNSLSFFVLSSIALISKSIAFKSYSMPSLPFTPLEIMPRCSAVPL
jgi:hypothetical protein